MKKNITIATHNGVFHADDVAAVTVLRCMNSIVWGGSVQVRRTRDRAVIEAADFVVDVGAEYSPLAGRYDHHQTGGAGIERANGIPYSSFGLVWAEFGKVICGRQDVADEIERLLVMPIDAADCGMRLYEGGVAFAPGVSSYSLSQVISSFNPVDGESTFDEAFDEACLFFRSFLMRSIGASTARIDRQAAVMKAAERATDPRIIELADGAPGWKDVVCQFRHALYVVFPAETGDEWMVQCVPPTADSFDKRKALPELWAGLRDTEFAQLTDVADAVFCHNGRFIAGARSKEGALRLAQMAVGAGQL